MLACKYESRKRQIRFTARKTTQSKAGATQKDKDQREAWPKDSDTRSEIVRGQNMLLSEVVRRLAKNGIGKVGTWKFRGRNGITLGDPSKYFPYAVGPQYPVDTTESADPDLTEEEISAIERRFSCSLAN
jgi:hypothetical protein